MIRRIPRLIRAALGRADIVLSLQETNIPEVGKEVAEAGVAAVVVPGNSTLAKNIALAKKAGIRCIIADPLLQPVGSGFTRSLSRFKKFGCPLFFGAGNVVELLDADSVGMNALLAGIAAEVGASVIFTSEHSDKTQGSIREMRRATEMMVLAKDRPYPKDLGIDLLVLKEKRRRREPPLEYDTAQPARPMPDEITYDPKGNFRIGIEGDRIVAVINGKAITGPPLAGCAPSPSCHREMSPFSTMQGILAGNSTKPNSRSGTGGASSRTGNFKTPVPNFYLPQQCTCTAWQHRHGHPISLSRLKTRQTRS